MPPATATTSGPSTRRNAKRASTSNNDSATQTKRVKVEQSADANPTPVEKEASRDEQDEGEDEDDEGEEESSGQNGEVLPTSKQILHGIFEERIRLIADMLSERLRERAQAHLGLFEPLEKPLPTIDSNGKAIEYTLPNWKRQLEEEHGTADLIKSKQSRIFPTDIKQAQSALVDLERAKQSRRDIKSAMGLTASFEKALVLQAREVSSQFNEFLLSYDALLANEVSMFTTGIDRYTRRP